MVQGSLKRWVHCDPMLRRVALRLVSGLLLASLAGCALNFLSEARAPWRDEVEQACFDQKLVVPSVFQRPAKEVDGKGTCGVERPLKVNAFANGIVAVTGGDVLLGCMMTYSMERWLREAVQPAAQARYGMPVTEVLTFGTYACRSRDNIRGAKLSEHAFANAFDVSGFRLADGRTIRVKQDWYGRDPVNAAFLREAQATACRYFTTVLAPGSDRYHTDHIHIDLAHHNAAGTSHYCRPTPVIPPPTSPYENQPMVQAEPGAPPYASSASRGVEPVHPSGPYSPPATIPLSYAQ
jgi:hypothetical protein